MSSYVFTSRWEAGAAGHRGRYNRDLDASTSVNQPRIQPSIGRSRSPLQTSIRLSIRRWFNRQSDAVLTASQAIHL
jgi:hypothetical protein